MRVPPFVVALAVASVTVAAAVAQDGGEVVTNELGTPCASMPATPEASPMASPEASPMASPDASPMASPMASPGATIMGGCATAEASEDEE